MQKIHERRRPERVLGFVLWLGFFVVLLAFGRHIG